MSRPRKNETGFSAVEVLLVLIIFALVGVMGFMVYNNHKKPTTTNATTKTATAKTAAPAAQIATFKIPELGIQLTNIPSTITNLTYYANAPSSGVDPNNTTMSQETSVSALFSTQSLTSDDSACSAQNGAIGVLARTDGTYIDNQPTDMVFVKQFDGFYIAYNHPQDACSDNSNAEALYVSQTAAFQTLVTDAANIEAL
jgi:Tfp pilus assembly protein PilX